MVQHHLQLPSGERIAYQLEHRQRRTIGLKITPNGLVIHAPKRLSQSHLESIIAQKADWIQKKIVAMNAHIIPPQTWQDGEQLLWLGNPITLNLQHHNRAKIIDCTAGILQVAMPNFNEPAAVARKVIQWYQKQALVDFSRRLALFSAKLGVQTPNLFLSNAQSRWGSCNSKKEIRLNWRLIQAPPHIINYVVCHELAHLKEMNHSAKFWAVVATLYPDYKLAEKELKAWSPKLHRI